MNQYQTEPAGLPRAFVVDIDGTTAIRGDRGIYDYSKVHLDRPNEPVVDVLRSLAATGRYRFVFVSGREDACAQQTREWLREHVLEPDALFMRSAGDYRGDDVVKRELFDAHIRGVYEVVAVFDDRDRVVRMWRGLGLTCLQVAEGDF